MDENELTDFFWDDLLTFMGEKKVIPILGSDISMVEYEGKKIPFQDLILEKIGDERYRSKRVARFIHIAQNIEVELPPSLQKLAKITDFTVYGTFGVDDLLTQALNEVRYKGQKVTQSIAFSPEAINIDLPKTTPDATVYHFFGKAQSTDSECGLNDEDIMEFILAFPNTQTKNLTLKLQESHLLFLGCGEGDWLLPFLIRIAKNTRLSGIRPKRQEFVVNPKMLTNVCSTRWFRYFNPEFSPIISMDPLAFIDELERRWSLRNAPKGDENAMVTITPSVETAEIEIPQHNYVFISYDGDDRSVALRLSQQLRDYGIPTWVDVEGGIAMGENFRQKFTEAILKCKLFLPIISATALGTDEGYFIEEWAVAKERNKKIRGNVFVIPLLIDGSPVSSIDNEFGSNTSVCKMGSLETLLTQGQLHEIKTAFEKRGGVSV